MDSGGAASSREPPVAVELAGDQAIAECKATDAGEELGGCCAAVKDSDLLLDSELAPRYEASRDGVGVAGPRQVWGGGPDDLAVASPAPCGGDAGSEAKSAMKFAQRDA